MLQWDNWNLVYWEPAKTMLNTIAAFLPALPILLMPLHIVFMELIIDPVCSIAFESEGLTLTGKQT